MNSDTCIPPGSGPGGSRRPSALFSREAWRYFLGYYRGLGRSLTLSTLGSAAQVVLLIPALLLVKYAFDVAIPGREMRMLIYIGTSIVLLRLVQAAVSLRMRRIQIGIINTAVFRLRDDLLHRLYSLPRSFHTQEDPRILHARIVQDTERLTNLSNALFSRIIPSLVISLALGVILLVLNWYLFLAILLLGPLIFLAGRLAGKHIKLRVIAFQRAFERFSKGVLFVLRYLDLTRIQSAEEDEKRRQTAVLQDLQAETGNMAYSFALNAQLQEFLTGLSAIVIIILGGASVALGWMSLGDFIAFYLAASFLNRYVGFITTSFPDLLAGNESMVTLRELAEPGMRLPYEGSEAIAFSGHLEMKGISFRYEEKEVLDDLWFELRPGEKAVIIGPNGSGKTTMIHLILGFYKPVRGSLLADGIPYERIGMSALRRSLGVVTQDAALFSGTIRENILYGSAHVTDEMLTQALEAAAMDAFLSRLPQGLDTSIGEEGVRISGGERQRIAIARALVRQPSLLILDEPTNHLDIDAVDHIMQCLSDLPYHPGILLISHDERILRFAPKVFHLDRGHLEAIPAGRQHPLS